MTIEEELALLKHLSLDAKLALARISAASHEKVRNIIEGRTAFPADTSKEQAVYKIMERYFKERTEIFSSPESRSDFHVR